MPRVASFNAARGRPPALAVVLAGQRPESEIYVRNKLKAVAEAGCRADLLRIDEQASLNETLATVRRLNADETIDAILVQSPLPSGMGENAEQQVFDAIDPAKDVDGFHPVNVGRLVQKRPHLVACTPLGCIELLERENIPLSRPPRRRHRSQRHRRQTDGAFAAASGRHGDHLPLAD